MAKLIKVPKYTDERGSLCVIEKILPFEIKRVFYIFDVKAPRGGHAHKKTKLALVSLVGECSVYVNNGKTKTTYKLTSPDELLILEPEDWHLLELSKNCVLLVLASEYYDKEDYIYEEPK
jgi:quercetin dioxygenase-like cupin family protein